MRLNLPQISASERPRAAAAAILALGCLASCVIEYPGSLEYDSMEQLLEGRTGVYSYWHPPVMSWMLGVSDTLMPGGAYFVLFLTLLAYGALISLLWLVPRVRWAAVAAAAVFVFLPQLFMFQGIVWKDVLFADACLVGFVCLAHAAARWRMAKLRFALLGASTLFLALAMLARQNGVIVLPCAALALGAIVLIQEKRWRAGAVYGAALLAASSVMALAANAALELRSDGSSAVEDQFKVLRLYDIAGMVKMRPDLPLPVLDKDAPELARLIRSDGVRLFSPVKNDTLETSKRLIAALDDTDAPVLAKQWRTLMIHYPATYLALRAELFRWVFFPPDEQLCHPYHVGYEGNPKDLKALGIRPRDDRRDYALSDYADILVGTPAYAHPVYALVALWTLVVLLRRRRPQDLAVAGLLAGALLFSLSFFVISIACDYRYLYLLDLSAIAGALYLLADRTV